MSDVTYGLSTTSRANNGPQAFNGGNEYFVLTNAMGTTAQLIKGGGGRACRIHNVGGGAASITLYDANSQDSTTLSTATQLFTGTVPTAVTPTDIQIPFVNGLVVKAGSAVANNIIITFI